MYLTFTLSFNFLCLLFAVVIVAFDRTEYSVQETSGSLTICARVVSPGVSCPVTTPLSLTLYVYDRTAGNDYCICVLTYSPWILSPLKSTIQTMWLTESKQ